MKFYPVAPRSEEWFKLRLGLVTSSDFHRVMTPKTRVLSKQADGLLYRLLGEWLTGEQVENFESEYMVRGVELEDQAISAFEMLTDTETQPGGFFTDDAGLMGCSPDRLIGDDGDLEIKAPLIQTQIRYALEGTIDEDYMCQLQGRLLITGRQYVEIFAYHPRLSIPPLRVKRNEEFIANLRSVLGAFIDGMLQKRLLLEQRYGPFTRPTAEEPYSGPDFLSQEDADLIAPVCVFPIGATTCGYTRAAHHKHDGSPMDHEFTPKEINVTTSPNH